MLSGCAGSRQTPEATQAEVQRAAARNDAIALRDCLSAGTITYLNEHAGLDHVDEQVAFMLDHLKPAIPFRVVSKRGENEAVIIAVENNAFPQRADLRKELRFVREGGQWKIDLVQDYQDWRRTADWVEEVHENSRPATPGIDGKAAPHVP